MSAAKGAVCLFSPTVALTRVFLSSVGHQQQTRLASCCCHSLGRRSSSSSRSRPGHAHGGLMASLPTWLLRAPSSPPPVLQRCAYLRPPRPPPLSTAQPGYGAEQAKSRPTGFPRPGPGPGSGPRPGPGTGQGKNRNSNQSSKVNYKLNRLPRDGEITHRYVILRQDDGTLSEPQRTDAVLARLDQQTQSLVVLALPGARVKAKSGLSEEDGEDGAAVAATAEKKQPQYPICRIIDRIAERKAEAEKERERRRKTVQSKELEINWAIDPHDLGHRLAKLREFLERGLRVEVTLLRKAKRGRRQATRDEANEVVRRVRETLSGVAGARECKPMEGELLRTAKFVLEGPAGGTRSS